jgi:hypothetical protein
VLSEGNSVVDDFNMNLVKNDFGTTKWGGFSLEEDKPAQSIRHDNNRQTGISSGGLKIRPTWPQSDFCNRLNIAET